MKIFYKLILEKYGYNEPIFTSELKKEINMNPNTFRQYIKRLSDQGLLTRVAKGIYFIPRENSVLKNPVLSVEKIINKRYLNNKTKVIGYKAGTNFANSLGLTTQTASIPTIVTNNTKTPEREVQFYNKKIVIKKPKALVNEKNYKLLQVLDLLNDFDRISEQPLDVAKNKISGYLNEVSLNEEELGEYLKNYPINTKLKVYESGLYNEITRR